MHIPVLLKEALRYLDPQPSEDFIDATAGEGGSSFAILKRAGPNARVLAIEQDAELVQKLRKAGEEPEVDRHLVIVRGNFRNLKTIVIGAGFREVAGILFDLGISSWHLETSGRGFSFQRDEPLDMRFDVNQKITASIVVNTLPREELADMFRKYGDEPNAGEIADEIVRLRARAPIERTRELREICERAGVAHRRSRIHPATRVFQALRIRVNDELGALQEGLSQTPPLLKNKGKIVVISFHSGEDRIVKRFFQEHRTTLRIITPKPIRPTKEEIISNPRARSAKLRAAELRETSESCKPTVCPRASLIS